MIPMRTAVAMALYDNWRQRRHPESTRTWDDLDPEQQSWFLSDAAVAIAATVRRINQNNLPQGTL